MNQRQTIATSLTPPEYSHPFKCNLISTIGEVPIIRPHVSQLLNTGPNLTNLIYNFTNRSQDLFQSTNNLNQTSWFKKNMKNISTRNMAIDMVKFSMTISFQCNSLTHTKKKNKQID